MPAFGPTDSYREAAGFSREYGNWNFAQYRDWLNRMQQSGAISDRLRDQLEQYAQRQIQEGFASPQDIRAIAEQIMPGVEEAIARNRGRLEDVQQLFNSRTMPADVMSRITDSINAQAEDIARTGEGQQREIDDLYGRTSGINEQTSGDIVNNIGETARSLQGGVNDSFGGLRRTNAGVRDRIVGATNRTYDDLGGRNSQVTRDLLRSGEGAFDQMDRNRTAGYGRLRGELDSTVGGLETGSRGTTDDIIARAAGVYSGAKGDTAGTYRDLEGSSVDTYDAALKDAEGLRPTSELQVARVARSYAPAMAAAASRLRRRGLSAGDPQFDAVLREVEADRARGMDDAAAASGERAVDRINELRIGKQTAAERLGIGRLDRTTDLSLREQDQYAQEKNALRDILNNLGLKKFAESKDLGLSEMSDAERQLLNREAMRQGLNLGELERSINLEQNRLKAGTDAEDRALDREINLGVGQSDRVTEIGDRAGRDYRTELTRRGQNQQQIEGVRTGANLDLADRQYDRTTNWRQRQQQSELLRRAMEQEDFDTAARIATQMNGEEVNALDLRNQAYQQGRDWVIDNYTRQDAGAANLGQIYAREGQREATAAQTARGFGQDAEQAYGHTEQREAGRGGWGTRLLGGIAQAGLSMIPGVGPILGGIAGQVTNAVAGQPTGQGGGGGGQQGGSNPYDMRWVIPAYQAARSTAMVRNGTGVQSPAATAGYQIPQYRIGTQAPAMTPPFVPPAPNRWNVQVDPLPR